VYCFIYLLRHLFFINYWHGDKFSLMQIRHGEAVGIIGPSGTGKSTILKIIAGLLAPDRVIIKLNFLLLLSLCNCISILIHTKVTRLCLSILP